MPDAGLLGKRSVAKNMLFNISNNVKDFLLLSCL